MFFFYTNLCFMTLYLLQVCAIQAEQILENTNEEEDHVPTVMVSTTKVEVNQTFVMRCTAPLEYVKNVQQNETDMAFLVFNSICDAGLTTLGIFFKDQGS